MARTKFSAVITLPITSKGLVTSGKIGRGNTKITASESRTKVEIEAGDMASFRAAINSAIRDLTIVDSISKIKSKTSPKE